MRTWTRSLCFVSLAAAVAASSAACGSTKSDSGFGESSSSGGSGSSSGAASGSSSGGSGSSSGLGGSSGSFGDGSVAEGGGSLGDAGCATASAKATKTPVYLLFVLDGSGSMSQDNKWTAATAALDAIFSDMQKAADTGVGVGLIVFSDSKDPTGGGGPYPSSQDVGINFVGTAQQSLLNARLNGGPSDGTPTGTALQGGYSELENYMALTPLPPGGQKVLVLITDGVPTDNCSPGGSYTSNACVVEAGQELTKAKPQGPILTYVIGTGVYPSSDLSNFDPNFLGNLALAGGTGPKGCNPNENTAGATDLCFFEVDPTAGNASQTEMAFENAINAIRGQVLSCTFPLSLDKDAGMIDPSKVNVTVDGMTVSQDPNNGWTYDNPSNPTEIIFHGTSCDNLKMNSMATVNIILGCATIIGPNM
ncbi:MAG TPA: vWA domain-containing protein [Polyangiaceae bacterium]|nr:vWA domain-containing protein [Polyangiaceae bacterium]